ncbi:hypothetical protein D6789_03120 [Candidatus Woesearchaeota archaeon]|nr:MAG: hypothetical protein D6789_03120 [Candidatus Woesearchaeota archaeon]
MRFVIAYALAILFTLNLLLSHQLLTGFLLALTLLWLLILHWHTLVWRSADYQGMLFIILSGIFIILITVFPVSFWTSAFGALLILDALFLLVHRFVALRRVQTLFDRFANGQAEPRVERLVREEEPTLVVATQGGTTYHRADCRLLGTKNVVQLSVKEAAVYGLKPCTTCKP